MTSNSSHPIYGDAGRVIVHEWAKLRWGVHEEHGYPGDLYYPVFSNVSFIHKILLFCALLNRSVTKFQE